MDDANILFFRHNNQKYISVEQLISWFKTDLITALENGDKIKVETVKSQITAWEEFQKRP